MKILALDTEHSYDNPVWAILAGYSYSWEPGAARYVPYRQGDPASQEAAVGQLQALINQADIVVMHNMAGDCLVLEGVGVTIPYDKLHDTIVGAAVLQEEDLGLKDLGAKHHGVYMATIDDVLGSGKGRVDPCNVPPELWEQWVEYACADADITGREFRRQQVELAKDPLLLNVYENIERPCFEAVVAMQRNGVLVDWPKLEELDKELEGLVQSEYQALVEIVGSSLDHLLITYTKGRLDKKTGQRINVKEKRASFNPASNLQVHEFLYRIRGYPAQTNIKSGNESADERSIYALWEKRDDLFFPHILEWRGLTTLKTRYLASLPRLQNPNGNKRLHPSFNLWGAKQTGRMASNEPNFQNIPVRS